VPAISNCLHHPNPDVRLEATRRLCGLDLPDSQVEAIVPALRVALKDENPHVRDQAMSKLLTLAPLTFDGAEK